MPIKPRRSYEAGHRPKFLVVVDESEECDRAVYFAARRAARVGADVLMLAVVEPSEFRHFLGVGNVMLAEAEEEAGKRLETAATCVRAIARLEPQSTIREGDVAQEILSLIEEDEDISLLVLAAGGGPEGPGPLVSTLAGKGGSAIGFSGKGLAAFPVPIAIVPGQLGDAEIDALA